MRRYLIYILMLSSCVLLRKRELSSSSFKKGELLRCKYVKYSRDSSSIRGFERIDTIQRYRRYLENNIYAQTDFQAYFPLKQGISYEDTVFSDTIKQDVGIWYVMENQRPIFYFSKDSIRLGEYGNSYYNSSTFYLKDKYIDSCTHNNEFIVKLRWDVFSKSRFSGDSVFNKGEIFCFSPRYGWVMGYPYNDAPEIYRLVQIESLTSQYRKNIDFEGLEKWMLK